MNQTNGTGGLSWVAINNLLSGLSALYDNRICFTVIERNEIDNDNLFGVGNGGNLYEQLITTNAVNDAIRIYFVENGNSGGIATSPILTPIIDPTPFTTDPTVYLSNGFEVEIGEGELIFVNTFTTEVLAHEIGHVFGLWHTHELFNGAENARRMGVNTNCNIAGDILCDTPADPGLNFLLNNQTGDVATCSYIGNLTDPLGDLYIPSTNNIMSYTHPTCMNNLTDGQIQRALDFMTLTNILDDIIIPEIINISGVETEDLYYHADEEIFSSVDHTSGIIEYHAQQTITLNPGFKTTSTANSEFLAKISDLCHDESIENSGFVEKNIYSRESINDTDSFILFPNPTVNDNISYKSNFSGNTQIKIHSINGELVDILNMKITSNGSINISFLSSGVYIFEINNHSTTIFKKLVIL